MALMFFLGTTLGTTLGAGITLIIIALVNINKENDDD